MFETLEQLLARRQLQLPHQFDAYLWFEQTQAVTPLPTPLRSGVPETYPFGL